MKARLILSAAVLCFSAAVWADDVSDALTRAADLYKAKRYVEAKTELEKALAALTARAKAQTPAPEIRDATYVNYEFNFRVTRPQRDWDIQMLKSGGGAAGATSPMCQITYMKEDAKGDDAVICYVRDLRAFYGARFDTTVRGNEMKFMKLAGQQMASAVKQFTDVAITGQTELAVSGTPGVRTDYTAKKGANLMRCFTVDVIRGHLMFTAMFIGVQAHDAAVGPAFRQIFDSIDLSPSPPPLPPAGR